MNKRIEEIASLISNRDSVIDIGCDHGFLAISLRKQGNKQLIICTDNKEGPLNSAKKNLVGYDNVTFYCTDGVSDIKEVVDTAVIAGMGNDTIKHILESGEEYFRQLKHIILQTNKNAAGLRKWIMENNYHVTNERVIYEGKYYEVIVCTNGYRKMSERQIEFGPVLLRKKEKIFYEYLESKITVLNGIHHSLLTSNCDTSEVDKEIERIRKVVK